MKKLLKQFWGNLQMERTDFIVIIPARYNSVRFPGKPLAKLKGKPLLSYVYERAMLSDASKVYIATDDKRIAELCTKINAPVVMTSVSHSSGTSRIYEAAQKLNTPMQTIIVNIQGDEPLLAEKNINQLANLLAANPEFDMASLTAPITNFQEMTDPNCVKVLSDVNGKAIYFSRSSIPFMVNKQDLSISAITQRHLGIYAYKKSFLRKYNLWQACAYEKLEKLEQLRAIYYGASIILEQAVAIPPPGVDTPQDLEKLENYAI